jgi:FkbM family methyltransferase
MLPPQLPGEARLGRVCLGRRLSASDVEVVDRQGLVYEVPSLREPIAFHLLISDVYEAEELKLVVRRLSEGTVFVDVGSSVGAFTLPAAKRVGSTGRVIAIEPSPRVFPYLQRNVERNGLRNVTLKRCAVTDLNQGMVQFYEAPVEHFGMGSLAPQFQAAPTEVTAQTLDSLLLEEAAARADVLKVDVEGFEASVFRGAERLLAGPSPPLVVFEFCDWAEGRMPRGRVGDAQRLLLDKGYTLYLAHDFVRGRRRALNRAMVEGCAMLVGERS